MPWISFAEPTPGRAIERAIEAGPLVRVLAVAQRFLQGSAEGPEGGRLFERRGGEVVGDGGVIGGGAGIGLLGQAASHLQRGGAVMGLHLGPHHRVIGDIDHDRDIVVVLGGAADHRGTADVDVLDAFLGRAAARHRGLERVEVDDQEVDRPDAWASMAASCVGFSRMASSPPCTKRMQGLQPAVHHLGKAGQVGDLGDGQARGRQRVPRAARRHQSDAALVEEPREIDEPRLVRNREQRTFDAAQIACHTVEIPEVQIERRLARADVGVK